MLNRQRCGPARLWPYSLVGASLLLLTVLPGCVSGPAKSGGNVDKRHGEAATLQQRHVDKRPEVSAIVRSGDPRAGLALRVGLEADLEETVGFAALISARLTGRAAKFEVTPGLDVVTVLGPLESEDGAGQVVSLLDAALRTEVRASEVGSAVFASAFRRILQAYRASDVALERRGCLREDEPLEFTLLAPSGDLALRLERQRRRAFTEQNARWGVVGSELIVSAVVRALGTIPVWPSDGRVAGRWPKSDTAQWVRANKESVRVVVRTARAEQVFALERAIRRQGGASASPFFERFLSVRLADVRTTALPRGGCLRVDIEPASLSEQGNSLELLSAARLVIDTVRSPALADEDPHLSMAQTALEQPNPIIAAALAAEVALSQPDVEHADRVYLQLQSSLPPDGSVQVGDWILRHVLGPLPAEAKLATLVKIEAGQGKVHALLASPCVPAQETKRLVGSTSLFLSAIAAQYSGVEGVTLRPWVSADGGGLFASTGKVRSDESADEQLERLGRVLGQSIAFLPKDNDAFWRERATALSRLGPGQRPALWLALSALAPDQPGLIAPEGFFSSVEGVQPLELRERERLFLSQELRLALLLNDSTASVQRLERALLRWIAPHRYDVKRCNVAEIAPALSGERQVDSGPPEPGDAPVTISIVLPSGDGADAIYANWLPQLLNSRSGWLEQLSQESKLAAQFDAAIVGGPARRGLVIAIGVPQTQVEAAISAIQNLFSDLGGGRKPVTLDYPALESSHNERELQRLSEPRQRLVELWSNRAPSPKPSEAGLRAYLRRAFATSKPMIVRATSKPEKAESAPARGATKPSSGTAKSSSKARSSQRR